MKIGSRLKCGFRRAGCEEVPMCKVPGKVRGLSVALHGSRASCMETCHATLDDLIVHYNHSLGGNPNLLYKPYAKHSKMSDFDLSESQNVNQF